jgi:UDP-3-O-[3-hydroxymyristoyl] glucosamine N-acyltransferase
VVVTVGEIAVWAGGEVVGDCATAVRAARPLGEASAGELTFVDGDRNLVAWHASPAAAAIVPLNFPPQDRPTVRVADPLLAFAAVVLKLRGPQSQPPTGIDPRAAVHPTAELGAGVFVGPFAVVGEGAVVGPGSAVHAGAVVGPFCRLGADVVLYPHAVIYERCVLGNRVTLHANSVVGADGYGYRLVDGRHVKVPQLSHVVIGDDVEIGAGTTIDRGTFSPTVIGEGTKLDNQVQIGHNCKIGEHNLLVSQVGIAGSCTTGDYVVMAGQAGIGDHIVIGDNVVVLAKAGVHKDIPAGTRVLGTPALPDREMAKIYMTLPKLPQMRRDLEELKARLPDREKDGGA